jgi:DedD protein
MARPISEEELQLKKRARRRLVGAIVLVTAVAVILPMVLDSEPKPVSQNVDIQIPSPDAGEFKPKGAAPGAGVRGTPPTSDAGAKSETAAPSPSAPGAAGTAAAPAVSAKEAAKAESAKAGPVSAKPAVAESAAEASKEGASPADGAFAVQVAALSDLAKARQLEKQMTDAGLKTYTQVVSTKSGQVTRVRAGPYPTREAAEDARAQLKKAGLEGKVVPK